MRDVIGATPPKRSLDGAPGIPQGLKPLSILSEVRPKPEGLGYLEAKNTRTSTGGVVGGRF
jgi:hypothetical protein